MHDVGHWIESDQTNSGFYLLRPIQVSSLSSSTTVAVWSEEVNSRAGARGDVGGGQERI